MKMVWKIYPLTFIDWRGLTRNQFEWLSRTEKSIWIRWDGWKRNDFEPKPPVVVIKSTFTADELQLFVCCLLVVDCSPPELSLNSNQLFSGGRITLSSFCPPKTSELRPSFNFRQSPLQQVFLSSCRDKFFQIARFRHKAESYRQNCFQPRQVSSNAVINHAERSDYAIQHAWKVLSLQRRCWFHERL